MFVVVDMVNVSWVWTRLMLEGVNKVTPRLRWVSVTVWMGLKRECSSQALLTYKSSYVFYNFSSCLNAMIILHLDVPINSCEDKIAQTLLADVY